MVYNVGSGYDHPRDNLLGRIDEVWYNLVANRILGVPQSCIFLEIVLDGGFTF